MTLLSTLVHGLNTCIEVVMQWFVVLIQHGHTNADHTILPGTMRLYNGHSMHSMHTHLLTGTVDHQFDIILIQFVLRDHPMTGQEEPRLNLTESCQYDAQTCVVIECHCFLEVRHDDCLLLQLSTS